MLIIIFSRILPVRSAQYQVTLIIVQVELPDFTQFSLSDPDRPGGWAVVIGKIIPFSQNLELTHFCGLRASGKQIERTKITSQILVLITLLCH
jgi:hypothetical protein